MVKGNVTHHSTIVAYCIPLQAESLQAPLEQDSLSSLEYNPLKSFSRCFKCRFNYGTPSVED
eukprot:5898629-Pyramimonas_sp.AAC.2